MKKYAALLFVLLLLVSCSEDDVAAPSSDRPTDEAAQDVAGTEDAPVTGGDRDRREEKRKGNGGAATGKKSATGGEQPERGSGRAASKGHQGDAAADDSGSDEDSPAVYPAAGAYVYDQGGYEKFCNGGACERRALPKRQRTHITLRDRSRERAVVVSETTASDDRMLRTTATYSRSDALITDVYTRLSYQGFAFENQYHPAPPVESLRFPLRDGAAWRGRWEDSTSGTYAVRVFGPTSVTVRGRAVRAFQVATTTDFEGEFNGEAKTLAWIDPARKAVLKISGSVDLTSNYGRYVSEFSATLHSGPRY